MSLECQEKISIIEEEMCIIYSLHSVMKDVVLFRELNNAKTDKKLGDLSILLEEIEVHLKNINKLF